MDQVDNLSSLKPKDKLECALKLNRQMQLQLLMAKDKIEKLLKNVQEIYSTNESIMRKHLQTQRRKGFGMRGAYLRGGTFYLKGNMFFKDFDCRNCPDNPDYKKRKDNNEMFPMDLDLQGRHVWSLKDKKGVVEGIKEQIIEHLKDCGEVAECESKEHNSEKLVKLLQLVGSDFRIDWQLISQYNLQHRHTAKSCEAIWNVYLNPSLKRTNWTERENLQLLEVAQKHNCQNWQAIAEEVGTRSDFQCFVQYQNYVCYMASEKSNRWAKEDDARLVEVIERNTINGIINWSNVMLHFPQKPRTTLHCRYTYTLSPHINRAPFTPEEDLLLLASVKEYGTKFYCFPRTLFPNRTTVQLRSRYHNTLVHRHKPKSWTLEDDTKLVEFVAKHGDKSWKMCQDFIETHSRISCRTRFLVISKFFKKNPDATLADLPRKKQQVWSYVNTQNWTEKLLELTNNPNAQLVKKIRKKPVKRSSSKKKTEKRLKLSVKKKDPKPKKQKIVSCVTDRRKPIYVDRLRTNSLKMYHSFKYAYNMQLGQDPCSSINASNCSTLVFVKDALRLHALPADVKNYRFDSNIPTNVRGKINKALKQPTTYQLPNGFSIPTSWSTAIGFRALCIHSARTDLQSVSEPVADNSSIHIQMFRQRLRTLFYTTALLSRIHPVMVGMGKPREEKTIPKRKHSSDSPPSAMQQGQKQKNQIENNEVQTEQVQKKPKIVHKSVIDQVLSIKKEKMEM